MIGGSARRSRSRITARSSPSTIARSGLRARTTSSAGSGRAGIRDGLPLAPLAAVPVVAVGAGRVVPGGDAVHDDAQHAAAHGGDRPEAGLELGVDGAAGRDDE